MINTKNKVSAVIIYLGMSLLTTIALASISKYGITGIDLLLPCVFALCVILFSKANKVFKKSDMKYTLPLGIVMSVLSVVGSHIDMDERIFIRMEIKDIAFMLILIPFFFAIFILLFFSSDICKVSKAFADVESNPKKNFYISMVALLVAWLPYYLTYYPGGIGNDIFECVNMCNGNIPLTNHHPVIFTAIMKVFITLFGFTGNATLALGMMTLCQMILLAFTLTTVLMWMKKRNAAKWLIVCSFAFFAFHPFVPMYSIYLTKDVLFACIVVLLIIYLYEFVQKIVYQKRDWVLLGALSFLTIITRNNGIMMIVFLAIFMFLLMRDFRKYIVITFVVVLGFNMLYKGPVWSILGIQKQSFAESASIPLSQVAYTICQDGEISTENREYLEALMPFEDVKKEYTPGYTDSYKFAETFNKQLLDDDPVKFLKVWADMLPDNFSSYVEVYLMQTSGYWCYGISNTVATAGVQPNDIGIEGHNLLGLPLDSLFEKAVLVARKLPVLCMLGQMSMEILAVILVGIQYIRRKQKKYFVAVVPLIALWMSILIATPAYCLFRYMCPVFFLWPVLIQEFFKKEDNGR